MSTSKLLERTEHPQIRVHYAIFGDSGPDQVGCNP